MRNKSRLKELGLRCDEYDKILAEEGSAHCEKNQSEDVHSHHTESGDSESEYDPLQDANGEGDLIEDDNAKVLIPSILSSLNLLFFFLIQYKSLIL